MKLELKYPLKHGEQEVKELEFRRPVFKDVKNIKVSDLDNFSEMIRITARLTGYPESIFLNMDMVDVVKSTKIVSNFLADSQEI